jgi:hypothetical protein
MTARERQLNDIIDRKMRSLDALRKLKSNDVTVLLHIAELEQEIDRTIDMLVDERGG